jgi:hypothetical protein
MVLACCAFAEALQSTPQYLSAGLARKSAPQPAHFFATTAFPPELFDVIAHDLEQWKICLLRHGTQPPQ